MRRSRVVSLALASLLVLTGCSHQSATGQPAEGRATDEAASDRGSYTFVRSQDDDAERPVAWDPCEPIEYYVNDELEPRLAKGLIEEGVAEISAASGLGFRYLGSTSRRPWKQEWELRPPHEPVVIGWETPKGLRVLSRRTVGVAESRWDRNQQTGELQFGGLGWH